ncbi:hypothetical protein [Leptospira perolatii]|nr:hypothetical protein [Leptospira perolatii]
MHKAFDYVSELTLRLVDALGEAFNSYYGVAKSKTFWKSVLIIHCRLIIEAIYDRYCRLSLISGLPECLVLETPEKRLRLDRGKDFCLELVYWSSFDWALSSHILIYSDLKEKVRLNYIKSYNELSPLLESDRAHYELSLKVFYSEFQRERKFRVSNFFPRVEHRSLSSVVLFHHNGREYKNDEPLITGNLNRSNKQFSIYYAGIPTKSKGRILKFQKVLLKYRENFSRSEFESYVFDRILDFLPERFFHQRIPIESNLRTLNISIPSGNILDAENRENHGLHYSIQHGGGYGNHARLAIEWNELITSDGLLTWGWDQSTSYSAGICIPLPNLKYKSTPCRQGVTSKNVHKIGIATTSYWMRPFRLSKAWLPEYRLKSLQMFHGFMEAILAQIPKGSLTVSLYNNELGIKFEDVKGRLKNDSRVEWKKMCASELRDHSDLIIIDHFGTFILEALRANVPTNLILLKETMDLNSETMMFLSRMEEVGIVHYTVESLADHLSEIKNNLDLWWNNPELQRVRQDFIHRFAWTDDNWIGIWKEFIEAHTWLSEPVLPLKSVPIYVEVFSFCFTVLVKVKILIKGLLRFAQGAISR